MNVDYLQDEERYSLVTATTEGGTIKIAAIDNGLAFPFKHPDEWRACMYNCKRLLASLSVSSLSPSLPVAKNDKTIHLLCNIHCRSILLGLAAYGKGPLLRRHCHSGIR